MSKKIHTTEDVEVLRAIMGGQLRHARKRLGLTQEEAAKAVEISTEFFARMERGHALPSIATLKALADALDVSVDWLLGDDAPMTWPELAATPPAVKRIAAKATDNAELRRILIAVLKYCDDDRADTDQDNPPG